MTEFYRFRSVCALLGMHSELERQTIFFAPPDDLNDPMEGFQDIVWEGDRTAWVNLFRDYVNCLHWSYHHVLVFGDDVPFEPCQVRGVPPWNAAPTAEAVRVSRLIWTRAQETAQIIQFAEKIAASGRKIRKPELTSYLRIIHVHALEAIRQTYIENGLVTEPDWFNTQPMSINLMMLAETLDQVQQLERVRQLGSERLFDGIFSVSENLFAQTALIYGYNNRAEGDSIAHLNKMRVFFYFPTLYVEQIGELLWPNWYAASFTKNPNNSSMWAHYGDKHKGACLIFEAEVTGDRETIALNRIVGSYARRGGTTEAVWDFEPMQFHEMQYQEKPGEVNFFEHMDNLPLRSLIDLWCTDENGNFSKSAGWLMFSGDESAWREQHWGAFDRNITFKTRDWEYEQEYRLVLSSLLRDSSDETARTLTYNFSSLKGIIFGMRMSDGDKLKIIEVIERKCWENNRTDFQFYQAYYSPDHGDIRRRELMIRIAGLDEK